MIQSSSRMHRGKTAEREDIVSVRFVELVPGVPHRRGRNL